MPELPDVVVYIEALQSRIVGRRLERVSIRSPFVLRTFEPPVDSLEGCVVRRVGRIGKRVVLEFTQAGGPARTSADGALPRGAPTHWNHGPSLASALATADAAGAGDPLFLVIHLMIAGRLRWSGGGANSAKPKRAPSGPAAAGKIVLAGFEFSGPTAESGGELLLTEVSKKKRASLHVVAGLQALRALDPGGMELLDPRDTHVIDFQEPPPGDAPCGEGEGEAPSATKLLIEFSRRLTSGNHTLKRALTNPRDFSGIGNAYSDEILHAARLSPVMLTTRLSPEQIAGLFEACRSKLSAWLARLRSEFSGRFPGAGEITAMRPDFAVHGRFGKPCPDCGHAVQRIRYAENETNYCPTCQTGGRVLADRSLSRLLKEDWPRTVEELEGEP